MKQSDARKLIESRITVDANGCWIWKTKRTKGYPSVKIGGKYYRVHRLSYMAYHGRIGDKHVCHHCDVTLCCNPEHLFLGTHQDNVADMVAKDRSGGRVGKNPRARLTDEQVIEIRRKHARGVPASWIADDFGIAASYVRDIVTGRLKDGYPTRYRAGQSA